MEGEGPLAPPRQCGPTLPPLRLATSIAIPEADRKIPACGSCKTQPEAKGSIEAACTARAFTDAERSLIKKIHGYMPHMQLLGILNDRLRSGSRARRPAL